MGEGSKIEWTDHTFNPWWGCVKVSEACAHCYAESFAKRTGHDVWGADKPRRFFGDEHWAAPLKWDQAASEKGERHRVFCASMADVFEAYEGPSVDDLEVARSDLFVLIHKTPNLDWLLLTKRPENILGRVPGIWIEKFPDNVWVGTTVENQEAADKRIPELLKVPAAVRFLSCEPLLGEVLLTSEGRIHATGDHPEMIGYMVGPDDGESTLKRTAAQAMAEGGIHWVICGGESDPHHGKSARPMHPDWARSLRDQCNGAGVSFFFKQWGDWLPFACEPVPGKYVGGGAFIRPDGRYGDQGDWWNGKAAAMDRVGKKVAGRLLDGREWNDFPLVHQEALHGV